MSITMSTAELYGKDAQEWLDRWDAGKSVWSIEMGGLGPGYEQCIQIICAEVLRYYLDHFTPDRWDGDGQVKWKSDLEEMEKQVMHSEVITKLGGISGAQWGAGVNLAGHLFKSGPQAVFTDEKVEDRHIQVMKHFPQG